MPEPLKSGWKTTEFWITLAGQGIALMVIMGVIKPAEQATLGEHVAKSVEAIFALIVSGSTLLSYIAGRTRLKER